MTSSPRKRMLLRGGRLWSMAKFPNFIQKALERRHGYNDINIGVGAQMHFKGVFMVWLYATKRYNVEYLDVPFGF